MKTQAHRARAAAGKNEERLPGRSVGRTNERKKDVGVTKSRMDGFGPGASLVVLVPCLKTKYRHELL